MGDIKKLYTSGTFDLLHNGHVNFLKNCYKICENVTVSLNTDDFIKRYKGSYPVMSYAEREAILLGCRYVANVIPNKNGEDSKPTILEVKPDFLVIGSDWAKKDYYAQMSFDQKWLDDNGILLCYIPYFEGISTTELKKRILTV